MSTFQRTATITITATITDLAGDLTDPGTDVKITITDPAGTEVKAAQAMTKQSTGVYTYAYAPGSSTVLGAYHVKVIANDGGPLTLEEGEFFLIG